MNVICIEEKAFDELIAKIYRQVKDLYDEDHRDDWISGEEAMRLLGIGKTTLQELRNQGRIRFSQPSKRIILYDRLSITQYIIKHARETF
jgi:hypothetical protein